MVGNHTSEHFWIAPSEFANEAKEAVSAIDRWVTEEIGENEEFIVIGV